MAVNLINSNDINITQTGNDIALGLTSSAVANKNVYSTTETIIGTYKGKPLYRKIVEGSSSVVDTNLDIPHGVSNVDAIMLASESYIKIGTNFFPINRASSNATNIDKRVIMTNLSATNITLYVGSYLQSSGYSYCFVIEYTKTTD